MYHPLRRVAVALFAGLVFAPLAPAAGNLPDPVQFRVRMEVGDIEQARAWLDAGLDPDAEGDRIGSGLMIAAWEGNIPLMELFVERGADVNRSNSRGETALMHAAWKGRAQAVRWLLARGARVERDPLQWTALHYAAFAGHEEVADLLLKRGADINARSPNGSSVLMMAVYEGREDMARRLLARGADATARNENGDGALEWAMKFNQPGIARMVAASAEEFRVAASRPRSDWGTPQKSEAVPKDLEELLGIRSLLAARNISVDKIDRDIAALRAKYARAAVKRQAQPPAALEISASRTAPGRQRARIVIQGVR